MHDSFEYSYRKMINIICLVFTPSCCLSLVGLLLAFAATLYFYHTKDFGRWEKKYGIKGLKPVPFFGTEKDLLMGKINAMDYVTERYKEFEGHRYNLLYHFLLASISF